MSSNLAKISLSILFIFTSLVMTPASYAWNMLGHMVVATIAYQNLKPAVRKNVDQMVAYFNQQYPEMRTFVDLSYWPDSVRSQKINVYLHWHYIDIPFTKDASPLVNTIKTENVVWALQNIPVIVKNFNANPYERVRFLSFLVHFVGDIHQPLHTATLISARHPTGDMGGNQYYVNVHGRKTKLHELWDKGVGVFSSAPSLQNAAAIAKRIMAFHPPTEFGNRIIDLDPEDWAKEGVNISQKYVYIISEDRAVDDQYLTNGAKVAETQAALAGYRLAEMLNEIL